MFLLVTCVWHIRRQLASRISSLPLDDAERRVISAASVDDVLRYRLQARSGSVLHVSLEHYHCGELVTCYRLGEMTVPKRQSLLYISWTELDSGPVEKWMVTLGDQHQVTDIPLPEFNCSSSKTWGGAVLTYGVPHVLYARALGERIVEDPDANLLPGMSRELQALMYSRDAFVLKVSLIREKAGD